MSQVIRTAIATHHQLDLCFLWYHGQQSNLVGCMFSWSQGLPVFFSWGWVLFRTQGRPRTSSPSGRYDPLIRSYVEDQEGRAMDTRKEKNQPKLYHMPKVTGLVTEHHPSLSVSFLFSKLGSILLQPHEGHRVSAGQTFSEKDSKNSFSGLWEGDRGALV